MPPLVASRGNADLDAAPGEVDRATPGQAPVAAPPAHPKYRPDIDGLRAVAVLSVVAFHVGGGRLSGGFVGVDVFFVISGYLITLIMHGQVDAGRFSILGFYERRARRILPALFATLLVTALVAWREMLPAELREFSQSMAAAILSVSNVFFWAQSGYFDTAAQFKPLLHTWSLAVEEQCYILLPVVLHLTHRWWQHHTRAVVAGLAALSLAVSAVGAFTNPAATFYLVHTRAWELLLGGLVALDLFAVPRGALARNVMAAAGLAMVLAAVLAFWPTMPFPGLTALLPCGGAALVILAGRGGPSMAGWLLSLRPVVFVGLISYSLYLWHWPIYVFQTNEQILFSGSPRLGKAVVVVVSLLVATLSWALVERPFRRAAASRRGVLATALGSAAALLAGCALLVALPSRFSPEAVAVGSYLTYPSEHLLDGSCFISSKYRFADLDRAGCLAGVPGRPGVLVLGDSEAAHLWYGLDRVLAGTTVLKTATSGCRPTLADAAGGGRCGQVLDFVFHTYLADHGADHAGDHGPDLLVLAARWSEADLPALDATLAWAGKRGLPVVLFGPMVEYDAPLPRLLAMALQHHDPGEVARHRTDAHALDAAMRALAGRDGARYVSLQDLLCPDGRCTTYAAPGVPLQFDYGHLTREGSVLLAERVAASGALRVP